MTMALFVGAVRLLPKICELLSKRYRAMPSLRGLLTSSPRSSGWKTAASGGGASPTGCGQDLPEAVAVPVLKSTGKTRTNYEESHAFRPRHPTRKPCLTWGSRRVGLASGRSRACYDRYDQ